MMGKRSQTNKCTKTEKPEKKGKIMKYISTENKKVNDSPVLLKREDRILLAFLEIIPLILAFGH